MSDLGQEMLDFAKFLFPICRSLTGNGVRQTLKSVREKIPELMIHEVPSGTPAFDWNVPKEWNIKDAYIIDPDGRKIIDFKVNNLHVVGYSIPVDRKITLEELQGHLFSLPKQPNAIPYVTSYYKEMWGFCLAKQQQNKLKPGIYHVKIDSTLEDGHLTYGEVILPGQTKQEIFLSTFICHPSMANNELSGPTVLTYLFKWLKSLRTRRYTYRLIFVPETIGSIVYLSRNIEQMKERILAGYNVSCVGDDRTYSFIPSRKGDTLADRVAQHVLKHTDPNYALYSFLDRGSDERQYNSPGVDLPVGCIMRSRLGGYPEYHTSLDNFDVVTSSGLLGGFKVIQRCLVTLEQNGVFQTSVLCEPQLGKRGLYPNISCKNFAAQASYNSNRMHLLAYADGQQDLLSIADIINVPMWELLPILEELEKHGLIRSVENG